MVLLHPFLHVYLEKVGLLVEKEFTGQAARQRAVLLLHYLATGVAATQEEQLALNKVLCGVAIPEQVLTEIVITEMEESCTQELYEAVLTHWDKLKDTSVEGLRESFIIRYGELQILEQSWKLRVESRVYDFLLESLPWSSNILKTPMMEKILLVEWT